MSEQPSMKSFTESIAKQADLAWLETVGRHVATGPDVAPVMPATKRHDYGEVVLAQQLSDVLARLNPALLVEALREALFREHEPKPWNPMIARTSYRRGIIETSGRGTMKIARLMEDRGPAPPGVSVREGSVAVTFALSAEVTGKTTVQLETPEKTEAAVLRLLQDQSGLTMAESAHRLGKSPSAIEHAVRRLRESGRLQRIDPDKTDPWQVIQ